jgi:hypothetical protein
MNLKTAVILRNLIPVVFFTAFALASPMADAATIWGGPIITFTKAPFADVTDPANQDRLTANVWITRGSSAGPFNAKTESLFTHSFSPADTEWASGQLADYATLTYTNWDAWAVHFPPGSVNQAAVVHLISDDIYVSLTFRSWSSGGTGGGFSYDRSTPGSGPPPPPAPAITGATIAPDGSFQFAFTNTPGSVFTVLATTNIALPLANWNVAGIATETPVGSGQYQFVDPGIGTSFYQRQYIVRRQ